jgi:purine-binding chemotaxis protein CheW
MGGKYLTFRVAEELYGIGILEVREIIGLMDITRVPCTRPFVRGVINLRGRVIPVIDIRQAFDMSVTEPTEHTVIIVVQSDLPGKSITMGVIVDEVREVTDIGADDVEPRPDFGGGDGAERFIIGVGKDEERVILLLDICRVLTPHQQQAVLSTAQA